LTPIAWVRNIAKFSVTYAIGIFMQIITLIVVVIFCISLLKENGKGPDLVPIKNDTAAIMLGFSIYNFEGIGVVMPVMATSEQPKKLENIMVYAISTICVVYIFFCTITYVTYGSDMNV
jgi:solute carrier family 36 (proton-coupled amino acid transporter)